MSVATPEQILCARTADLPPRWLPEAGTIPLTETTLLAALADVQPHWVPRGQAEDDPAFKQWIPYVLLRNSGGELAAYPRQGNEARLHGLWSLGIGGHINPVDGEGALAGNHRTTWQQAIQAGMQRELTEEFPAAALGATRLLGLIHESQTSVGRVHLGVVFLHEPNISDGEPGAELTGLEWLPRHDIGHGDWPFERFELWSRLALELIS